MEPTQETTPEITLKDAIKALRIAIDGDIRSAQSVATTIARGVGGREIALAITKLQEAGMWADQALREIGGGV